MNAVFPPASIQSVTGVKTDGVHLDTVTILEPIAAFIPSQPVIEEKVDQDTSDNNTEFVKERMGEIATALDGNEVSDIKKEELKEDNSTEQLENVTEQIENLELEQKDNEDSNTE